MPNYRPDGPARSNQSAIIVVPFSQNPYAATFDPRLQWFDKALLNALLFFALDSDRCTASDGRLADLLGVDGDTVWRGLRRLRECGYTRHEKAPRSATNATGRVIVLAWRTDPSVLPAVPDRHRVRLAEGTESPEPRRPRKARSKAGTPAPLRVSEPEILAEDTRTAAGVTPAPLRVSTPAPLRDKEEGSGEVEECRLSSSCTDARGSDREEPGGAELDGAEAEAMAGVRRCIQATPRTERDARKLIAQVGAEVVAGAAEALRGEIDGGAVIRYPMRWLERTARLMHAEGGAPGRAIPSADPAATAPRAGRPDAPRPSRHQAEVRRQADAWRAEAERRRLDGDARLDGPAPLPVPHFASSVSKREAARLHWDADLDREKARRLELYGDGD